MKSIKKKLFFTILSVVFGFGILIFLITFFQLFHQKNTIREQGQQEAQVLSEETSQTLGRLNEQIAKDFSGSCTKYFNTTFANIRKHVVSIQEDISVLYREGKKHGRMDANVGLMKGVKKGKVAEEFSVISPVRSFIKYLPAYDTEDLSSLDLYTVTESGMCLDGTETALGNNYADLRKEAWYRQGKKTGKIYWSGIFKGKVTGKVKVTCAVPFYDKKGRFRGCVAGDVAVEAFQKMIEKFDEKQIVSVIFFDKNNKLMYATNGYKNTDKVSKYLGKEDVVSLGNEMYSFTTLEETGWKICLVLNQKEVGRTMTKMQSDIEDNAEEMVVVVQKSIQNIILFFVISMAVGVGLAAIISNFVAAGFVRPIRQLMSQVKEVGSGNLHQVIAVQSKDEIGQLANAFQDMTGELCEYMDNLQTMAADKERMIAELNIARQIQMNMLPSKFPAFPEQSEFDIYAIINAADTGGGNFYDFFMVDKTHFCMVIGDVTGVGVPTTLFAVITKTHIKNYAQIGYPPDRILAETNNQLSDKNEAGLTVSVFLGIVDLQTGIFEYINAGQMAPLWKHSGNDFEFLKAKSCFALANMENVPYWKQSIQLSQGDLLFMYTQGVSETTDAKGNEYTQEYLYEYLNSAVRHQYELKDITDSIQENLQTFSGGIRQKKDRTMMLFRYFGK